mmetsp:Transcript_59642/g.193137  ORF Transcript_59642/g.193137 Transcript_59642/m.193137 type:complete len:157 (+) Transcript_59642:223-693(+)
MLATAPRILGGSAEFTRKILDMAYHKAQPKWVQKHSKASDLQLAACAITKASVNNQVDTMLSELMPATVFENMRFVGSEKDGSRDIFSLQFYSMNQDHAQVSMTPFGVGEVRFVLEGFELLLCVQVDKMDGTMKAKIDTISELTGSTFSKFVIQQK